MLLHLYLSFCIYYNIAQCEEHYLPRKKKTINRGSNLSSGSSIIRPQKVTSTTNNLPNNSHQPPLREQVARRVTPPSLLPVPPPPPPPPPKPAPEVVHSSTMAHNIKKKSTPQPHNNDSNISGCKNQPVDLCSDSETEEVKDVKPKVEEEVQPKPKPKPIKFVVGHEFEYNQEIYRIKKVKPNNGKVISVCITNTQLPKLFHKSDEEHEKLTELIHKYHSEGYI